MKAILIYLFSVGALFMLSFLWITSSRTQRVKSCNQDAYDDIYRRIIEEALSKDLSAETFKVRNREINALRKLCNNQKSSWERGLDVKRRGDNRKRIGEDS